MTDKATDAANMRAVGQAMYEEGLKVLELDPILIHSKSASWGVGYEAGYKARDAETCVWTVIDKGFPVIGCNQAVFDDIENAIPPFCPDCGGLLRVNKCHL